MSQAEQDRRVDYIEFPTNNIEETKRFYSEVFDWEFTDYGPDYSSFSDGRLAGGFSVVDLPRIGGRLSACVFSLLPRAFGVRSFRCAGGAGE